MNMSAGAPGRTACTPLFIGTALRQLRVFPVADPRWREAEDRALGTDPEPGFTGTLGYSRAQMVETAAVFDGRTALDIGDEQVVEIPTFSPTLEELRLAQATALAAGRPPPLLPPVMLPAGEPLVAGNTTTLGADGTTAVEAEDMLASARARHLVVAGGAALMAAPWSEVHDLGAQILEDGLARSPPPGRVVAVVPASSSLRVGALTVARDSPTSGALPLSTDPTATWTGEAFERTRGRLVVSRGARVVLGGTRGRPWLGGAGATTGGGDGGDVAGRGAALATTECAGTARSGPPRTRAAVFTSPHFQAYVSGRGGLAAASDAADLGTRADATPWDVFLPTVQLADTLSPVAAGNRADGWFYALLDVGIVFLHPNGTYVTSPTLRGADAIPDDIDWLDLSLRLSFFTEDDGLIATMPQVWASNGTEMNATQTTGFARGGLNLRDPRVGPSLQPCRQLFGSGLNLGSASGSFTRLLPGSVLDDVLCYRLLVQVKVPRAVDELFGSGLVAANTSVQVATHNSAGRGRDHGLVSSIALTTSQVAPSQSPSAAPTPSATPSPTLTSTSTPTASPTASVTASPTASTTPTAATAVPTPTATPSPGVAGAEVSTVGGPVFAAPCCGVGVSEGARFGTAVAHVGDVDWDGWGGDVAVAGFTAGSAAGLARPFIALLGPSAGSHGLAPTPSASASPSGAPPAPRRSLSSASSGPSLRVLAVINGTARAQALIGWPEVEASQVSLSAVDVSSTRGELPGSAMRVTLVAMGLFEVSSVYAAWVGVDSPGGVPYLLQFSRLSRPAGSAQFFGASVLAMPPSQGLSAGGVVSVSAASVLVGSLALSGSAGQVMALDVRPDGDVLSSRVLLSGAGLPLGDGSAEKLGNALAATASLWGSGPSRAAATTERWLVVAGAPGRGGGHLVLAAVGSSGALESPTLIALPAEADAMGVGTSLALPGDIDGDGFQDAVAGSVSCAAAQSVADRRRRRGRGRGLASTTSSDSACVWVVWLRGEGQAARGVTRVMSSSIGGYSPLKPNDGFGSALALLPTGPFEQTLAAPLGPNRTTFVLALGRPDDDRPPVGPGTVGSVVLVALRGRPEYQPVPSSSSTPTPSTTRSAAATPSSSTTATLTASPSHTPTPSSTPTPWKRRESPSPTRSPVPSPGASASASSAPLTEEERRAEDDRVSRQEGLAEPVRVLPAPVFAAAGLSSLRSAAAAMSAASGAAASLPPATDRRSAPAGSLFLDTGAGGRLTVCAAQAVLASVAGNVSWAPVLLDVTGDALFEMDASSVTAAGLCGAPGAAAEPTGQARVWVTVDDVSIGAGAGAASEERSQTVRVCFGGLESLVPGVGGGVDAGGVLARARARGASEAAVLASEAAAAGPGLAGGLGGHWSVLETAVSVQALSLSCGALGVQSDAPALLLGLAVVLPSLRVFPASVDRTVNLASSALASGGGVSPSPVAAPSSPPNRRGRLLSGEGVGNATGAARVGQLVGSNEGSSSVKWAVALSEPACWASFDWSAAQSREALGLGAGSALPAIEAWDEANRSSAQCDTAVVGAALASGTGIAAWANASRDVACGSLAGSASLSLDLSVSGLDALPPATYSTGVAVAAADPLLPGSRVVVPWTLRLTALGVCPSSGVSRQLWPEWGGGWSPSSLASGGRLTPFAAAALVANSSSLTRRLAGGAPLGAVRDRSALAAVLSSGAVPSSELLQRVRVSNLGGSAARLSRVWAFEGGRVDEASAFASFAASSGAANASAGACGGSAGGDAAGAMAALGAALDFAEASRGLPSWLAVAVDDVTGVVKRDSSGAPVLAPGSSLELLLSGQYSAQTMPAAVSSGVPSLFSAVATVGFQLEEAVGGAARRAPEIRQIEVRALPSTGGASPSRTLVVVPPSSAARAAGDGEDGPDRVALVSGPDLSLTGLVQAAMALGSSAGASSSAQWSASSSSAGESVSVAGEGEVPFVSSEDAAVVVVPRDAYGVARLVAVVNQSAAGVSASSLSPFGGRARVSASVVRSAAGGAASSGASASVTGVLLRGGEVASSIAVGTGEEHGTQSGALAELASWSPPGSVAPSMGSGGVPPAESLGVLGFAVSVSASRSGSVRVSLTVESAAAASGAAGSSAAGSSDAAGGSSSGSESSVWRSGVDVSVSIPAANCSASSRLSALSAGSALCGCAAGHGLTSNATLVRAVLSSAAQAASGRAGLGAAAAAGVLSPWRRGSGSSRVAELLFGLCERCPRGSVSESPTLDSVSRVCRVCPSGSYAGPGARECLACPPRGAHCEGGVLFALPGWWVETVSDSEGASAGSEAGAGSLSARTGSAEPQRAGSGRALQSADASGYGTRLHPCPLSGACEFTGSMSPDDAGRMVPEGGSDGDAAGAGGGGLVVTGVEGVCSEGHSGPLCGECWAGYAHSPVTAGVRAPCVECASDEGAVFMVASVVGLVWAVWLTTLWAWGAAPAADVVTGIVDVRSLSEEGQGEGIAASAEALAAEAACAAKAACSSEAGGSGSGQSWRLAPTAAAVGVIRREARRLVLALARPASLAARASVALHAVAAAQVLAFAVDAQPGASPWLVRWLRLAAEVVGFGVPVTTHEAACWLLGGVSPADSFALTGLGWPVLCVAAVGPVCGVLAWLATRGAVVWWAARTNPRDAPVPGAVAAPSLARFLVAGAGVWSLLSLPRSVTVAVQYSAAIALPESDGSSVEPALSGGPGGLGSAASSSRVVLQLATNVPAGWSSGDEVSTVLAAAPFVAAAWAAAGLVVLVVVGRWAASAVAASAKVEPRHVSFSAGARRVPGRAVGDEVGTSPSFAPPGRGAPGVLASGSSSPVAGASPVGAASPPVGSLLSGRTGAAVSVTQGTVLFRRGVPAAFTLTWPAWALTVHRSKPNAARALSAGVRDVVWWFVLRLLAASAGVGMVGPSSQFTLACAVLFLLYGAAAARGHCDRRLSQMPRIGAETVLLAAESAARSAVLEARPPARSSLEFGQWLTGRVLQEAAATAAHDAEEDASTSPGGQSRPGASGAGKERAALPGPSLSPLHGSFSGTANPLAGRRPRPRGGSSGFSVGQARQDLVRNAMRADMGILPVSEASAGAAVAAGPSQAGLSPEEVSDPASLTLDNDRARAARARLPGMPSVDAMAAFALAGAAVVDGMLLLSWWARDGAGTAGSATAESLEAASQASSQAERTAALGSGVGLLDAVGGAGTEAIASVLGAVVAVCVLGVLVGVSALPFAWAVALEGSGEEAADGEGAAGVVRRGAACCGRVCGCGAADAPGKAPGSVPPWWPACEAVHEDEDRRMASLRAARGRGPSAPVAPAVGEDSGAAGDGGARRAPKRLKALRASIFAASTALLRAKPRGAVGAENLAKERQATVSRRRVPDASSADVAAIG
ncbi:hypothetical protein FNF27_04313 [Cafeteria roenbergensis]|uniref:Uncharacterized protein n=2 Tax=Cafeteria roenbergensis TaxID=33653 RepID=A0A5A8EEM3_CAFRO|nr:hypothetical protein FNF27_04313 [Cafeteria roenbergensis]